MANDLTPDEERDQFFWEKYGIPPRKRMSEPNPTPQPYPYIEYSGQSQEEADAEREMFFQEHYGLPPSKASLRDAPNQKKARRRPPPYKSMRGPRMR